MRLKPVIVFLFCSMVLRSGGVAVQIAEQLSNRHLNTHTRTDDLHWANTEVKMDFGQTFEQSHGPFRICFSHCRWSNFHRQILILFPAGNTLCSMSVPALYFILPRCAVLQFSFSLCYLMKQVMTVVPVLHPLELLERVLLVESTS